MITNFKIFENENRKYEDADDLSYLFDDKYIEKYFKENYEISIQDVIEFINLWAYVDKNGEIVDGIIDDLVHNIPIDDEDVFTKNDYANYIKSNMLIQAKKDIEKYREEYEEYDLDDEEVVDLIAKNDILNKDLINIISKYDEDKKFKLEYFEEKYFNKNAEEILIDVYGEDEVETNLYDLLFHHIDENQILDEYIDSMLFDYKWEYFTDAIPYDIEIQKECLKKDHRAVLGLYNVIESGLANTYEFQKLYIEEKYKETKDNNTKAMAIKEVSDKFNLNDKIKEEYKDYMYMVDSEKYNI